MCTRVRFDCICIYCVLLPVFCILRMPSNWLDRYLASNEAECQTIGSVKYKTPKWIAGCVCAACIAVGCRVIEHEHRTGHHGTLGAVLGGTCNYRLYRDCRGNIVHRYAVSRTWANGSKLHRTHTLTPHLMRPVPELYNSPYHVRCALVVGKHRCYSSYFQKINRCQQLCAGRIHEIAIVWLSNKVCARLSDICCLISSKNGCIFSRIFNTYRRNNRFLFAVALNIIARHTTELP